MKEEEENIGQRAHSAIQYEEPSYNSYYSCPLCQSGNLKPPWLGDKVRGRELLKVVIFNAYINSAFGHLEGEKKQGKMLHLAYIWLRMIRPIQITGYF